MKKLFDGFVLIMVALVTTAIRDVVVFENGIGIAQIAGAIGDKISVDTVGVYEFTGTTADTIAAAENYENITGAAEDIRAHARGIFGLLFLRRDFR